MRQYDDIRDFKNGRGAGFKKPLPLVAIAVFVVAINVLFFLDLVIVVVIAALRLVVSAVVGL